MKAKPIKILITAGPTRERIDPVRYLSNDSSGKMGYALAEAAKKMGMRVTLVSGPTALTPPTGVRVVAVESALEMRKAVLKNFKNADITIKAAAVADYRPASAKKQKIKKTASTLHLSLVKNPDILKELGTKKKANQILVGFAAETQSLLKNARKKLTEKKCDWVVANNVAKKGLGFSSDRNEITLLHQSGRIFKIGQGLKTSLAKTILEIISN